MKPLHKVLLGAGVAALAIVGAVSIQPVKCHSVNGLPDSKCTPGVVRTTDKNVICTQSTGTIRPPSSYTTKLKIQQLKQYDFTDKNLASYEEDHLISLEIGGDPTDPKNLWPEPYAEPNGAHDKDKVENLLHKRICNGEISPQDAQKGISTNWKQYQ
jgi:hypothetical protein